MITLTDRERIFLYNEFITIVQNMQLRELYGEVVCKSILSKIESTVVSFTQQESNLLQSYLVYRKEGLGRLTDKRLQHILMTQNHQGFGAPGNPGPTNLPPSVGGNIAENFFNPYTQYNLVLSILNKLVGS